MPAINRDLRASQVDGNLRKSARRRLFAEAPLKPRSYRIRIPPDVVFAIRSL